MYDFCKMLVKLCPYYSYRRPLLISWELRLEKLFHNSRFFCGKIASVILVPNRTLIVFLVYFSDLFRDQSYIPFSLCFSRLMLLFLFCLLVDMIFKQLGFPEKQNLSHP